jgi:hypothetical protein
VRSPLDPGNAMERSASVLIVLAELAREAQARRCPPRGLGLATATTSATSSTRARTGSNMGRDPGVTGVGCTGACSSVNWYQGPALAFETPLNS